jgi:hypothetical protein
MFGSSWVAAQLAASQEGLSSTKLISYKTVVIGGHIYILGRLPIQVSLDNLNSNIAGWK